jgi:hypothetical protein
VRSKKPPIPPAPSHSVLMVTRDFSPLGSTVNVVTMLESASVSTRVRPGSGSVTVMWY